MKNEVNEIVQRFDSLSQYFENADLDTVGTEEYERKEEEVLILEEEVRDMIDLDPPCYKTLNSIMKKLQTMKSENAFYDPDAEWEMMYPDGEEGCYE